MSKHAFVEGANRLFNELLGKHPESTSQELIASGFMDSLTMLQFYLFVEEQVGGDIPAEAIRIEDLATLDSAYELLSRLRAAG